MKSSLVSTRSKSGFQPESPCGPPGGMPPPPPTSACSRSLLRRSWSRDSSLRGAVALGRGIRSIGTLVDVDVLGVDHVLARAGTPGSGPAARVRARLRAGSLRLAVHRL